MLAHKGVVVIHQVPGDLASREPVLVDFCHRRHLHGGPRQEHLLRLRKLLRLDLPLDHLVAPPPGEVDGGAASNAVEKAVRRRRVDLAVLHQKHVGTGRLRNQATIVEHKGVGIDRKSTRLNSSHYCASRMPSSAGIKKKITISTY